MQKICLAQLRLTAVKEIIAICQIQINSLKKLKGQIGPKSRAEFTSKVIDNETKVAC